MARRGDDELRIRARQQAAVAELGQRALAGLELTELLDAAADVAAEELGAELVSVLELTRDEAGLLIRSGRGLPEGVLGGVLDARRDTLPGYALRSERPLVVTDFAAEERFRPSALARDIGAASAMAAPVGVGERPFGVISALSRAAGHFSVDDAWFLQALANVVGAAAERARTEELVRDSERRFRELADTAPALMWMSDQEGHVTFVNEGWLRFTGRTFADELGDSFASSAHPDDRPPLLEAWRRALESGDVFREEYRLRRHDGKYRWVLEVAAPRFSGGEFLGFVGTATDIDERKQMEEALRASEQSFRQVADSAPVMIWTCNAEGYVTFVNRGWMEFTGTTLEDELGPTWSLGVHPDDAREVVATWDAALARRDPWEREYRLRRHDGEYRWVVDRGVPRFEGGRFAGYVGTANDIHERRTMEERLREVYEREHRIAETLQRSLLPERLAPIEGISVAARYLPAGRESGIGGDWYDVLELRDGRVALVVGDVVGHGLRAAAAMGRLRNAFRAYALVESSPAEVVARMNRLVMSGGEETMATVLFLLFDRETGRLTFTAAGHPPPLVLGPDGARFLEDGRSMPLGAADAAVFREGIATLEPGSTLLLYTDGLVERRDVPLEDRLSELVATAGEAGEGLEELCDHILAGVLGDDEPADDVALLAVRAQPAAFETLRLRLPAEPEALPALRQRLGRFLHAAGASDAEVYEITLTISEAAGNAIEHAYGPGDAAFEIEVGVEGDELVAAVRDRGRWRERRGKHRGRGLKIIEGLMDDVEVTSEQDGTVVRMRRRLKARVAA